MKILHRGFAVLLCILILLSDSSIAFASESNSTNSAGNANNANVRKIRLDAGKGTVDSETIVLECGQTLPQRLPEAKRTGWIFEGWYTAAVTENFWGDQEDESFSALLKKCNGNQEDAVKKDFTWIVESEGTLVRAGQKLPADVNTLYAMYRPTNDITIRWHYNGWKKNTGVFLTHRNKEYDSPVVLADLESFLTWEDHQFTGWYTADGTEWKFDKAVTDRDNGRVYYISDNVVTKDLDLYAHWSGRVEPDKISLSYKNGLVEPGEDVSISASYLPLSADAPELEWSVDGGSDIVASKTVSDNGLAITLSIDENADVIQSNKSVTVTAQSKTNPALSATVSITVGHSWKMAGYEDSTCDKAGVKHYQCTKHADAVKHVALAPDGHRFIHADRITIEPTCVTEGSHTDIYSCIVCHASNKVTTVIPATGIHTWNTYEITIEPTCAQDGLMTYACADCDATKEEPIPATGLHQYEKISTIIDKEATCADSGLHTDIYTCTVCGAAKTEQVTDPATGIHDFIEIVNLNLGKTNHYQSCKVCGMTEFLYTEETGFGGLDVVIGETDDSYDNEEEKPSDEVTDSTAEPTIDPDDTGIDNAAEPTADPDDTVIDDTTEPTANPDDTGNYDNTVNAGTADAKKVEKKNATDSETKTVAVKPSSPALSSAKNIKGNKLLVQWTKNTTATQYQIQYSTDKDFENGVKTITISKNSTVSKTIRSLKKGKSYRVRVRACKAVSGKKYYSDWSNVRKVTIKK